MANVKEGIRYLIVLHNKLVPRLTWHIHLNTKLNEVILKLKTQANLKVASASRKPTPSFRSNQFE